MLKEIIISLQAYYHTHRFIIRHRLWKWILIPGIIYTLLFCLGIYLFVVSSNNAIDFMLQKSGVAEWMEKMQNSWLSFLLIFGQIILNLILLLFYFSLFKYLFLIIGSPLFVKYNDAIMCRIEKSPVRRTRARARSAMQENDRFSVWIAGFFPIHLMALIQPEMIAAQWRNVGIEIGA